MEGFDPSLSLKDEWTKIHEQLALLKEEETGFSAFCQWFSERQNVTSNIKRLLDLRDELKQKIQGETAERQDLFFERKTLRW